MRVLVWLTITFCLFPIVGRAQDVPAAENPPSKENHSKFEEKNFDIGLDGSIRVEGSTFVPDRFLGIVMPSKYERESLPTVGRNDGFALANARLNLRASFKDNLYVRLGFDGATVSYSDNNDPAGTLTVGMRDAYLRYTFAPQIELSVGRFKPPFDVEDLTPPEARFFVHRSLESRGVLRQEGPHVDMFGQSDMNGFAPGRQLGVLIGSEDLLEWNPIYVGYALALTNGNSGDKSLNDNDLPALWIRLFGEWNRQDELIDDEEGPATYDFRSTAQAGLGFFVNTLTSGVAPNRLNDRVLGAGLDVAWQGFGFHVQGQMLAARLESLTQHSVPKSFSLGGHLQIAVEILKTGVFPGYRFAYLDPRITQEKSTTTNSASQDRVMHHTLGIAYRLHALPIVMHVEYTRSLEQAGRAMPNDRLEAAVQVTFQ